MSSLRNEQSLKDFIQINGVNWRKIENKFGLSDNLNQFAKQVITIINTN